MQHYSQNMAEGRDFNMSKLFEIGGGFGFENMGSEMNEIESLMRYFESLEDQAMGSDLEKYRHTAKLLDDCKKKKFPNLERLGLIQQHKEEEEND